MTLYSNLIVIPMVAFDKILGMNWLTNYRVVIDCQDKTVRYMAEGCGQVILTGSGTQFTIPFISALKAYKLLPQALKVYFIVMSIFRIC